MFRLIHFVFTLVMLAVLFWFATNVQLGNHTLWGHLKAIFGTQEAKDLAQGTKEEAEKVAKRLREKHDGGHGKVLDTVDDRDQKKLDDLVRQKVAPAK